MKTLPFWMLALLALPLHAKTHTWSGNGVNDLFSNPANWSSGGVPAVAESSPVILTFPSTSGSPTPLDDIPSLSVDGIIFDGGGYNLRGLNSAKLTFRNQSAGAVAILCTNSGASSNKIESTLPIALGSKSTVKTDNVIYLDSAISGSGGLNTEGGVWLRGTSPNTQSGYTDVISGTLHLAKSNGLNCMSAGLSVWGGTLKNEADDQIPDTSVIVVRDWGIYAPGLHSETIGGLVLANGTVDVLVSNSLTLAGGVSATYQGGSINGYINLGGAIRTFAVDAGAVLTLNADITGGSGGSGGITKTGGGTLDLKGSGNFTGAVNIAEGICSVSKNTGLGSTNAGTTVASGATLKLAGPAALTISEPLYLSGTLQYDTNVIWSAGIVLTGIDSMVTESAAVGSPTHIFTHSSIISGSGRLTKNGLGRLDLLGNSGNTYSGGTLLMQGDVYLGKTSGDAIPGDLTIYSATVNWVASEQIADGANITIGAGRLDLGSRTEKIDSLIGGSDSEVKIALGQLILTSGSYSGLLSGSGETCLVKTGFGILSLSNSLNGGNTLTGTIAVNQGSFVLDGIQAGPVTVNPNGFLTGTGAINAPVSISGGIGLGTLKTGNLYINTGAVANAAIHAGGDDHVAVTGAVFLTGCALNLTVTSIPYVGSSFTLIDNDGIDPIYGEFTGMPEGAVFTIASRTFKISYQGGTGNDLVLSLVSGGLPLPVITSFTVSPVANTNPAQVGIVIAGTSQPNTAHHLQTSADLLIWQDLPGTLTSDAAGHFNVNFGEPSSARRFYRLAVP